MRPVGKYDQAFNETSAIEYFKEGEFKKIPQKLLMDFLPRIHNTDIPILESWKAYFKQIGTPFSVTQTVDKHTDDKGRVRRVDRFILWKQRRT